jgi:hypothetical protein
MVNDLLTLDKIGGLWYSGGGYQNVCSGRDWKIWKAGRLGRDQPSNHPIFQLSGRA